MWVRVRAYAGVSYVHDRGALADAEAFALQGYKYMFPDKSLATVRSRPDRRCDTHPARCNMVDTMLLIEATPRHG